MNSEHFFFPSHVGDVPPAFFTAAGKALALASRFEASCRVVSMALLLRADRSILASEKSLRSFTDEIDRRGLNRHILEIRRVVGDELDLFRVLNGAREARNHIAHELMLGFEEWLFHEEAVASFLGMLQERTRTLAEGERVAAFIGAVVTKAEIPTGLAGFPEDCVAWVMDGVGEASSWR